MTGAARLAISPAAAGEMDDTMERLGVVLPISIAHMSAVGRPLEELSRERCDQAAIFSLADALQNLGRRREAATAQMNFSRSCNGHATSVRRAVNILLQLNDSEEVVNAATELIGSSVKLSPAHGITEGRRGHAKSVALKKLVAQNVTVVVQADQRGTYGDKIDGLLGMSFLSRFNVTIDAKSVRLKPRNRG